MPGLTDSPVPRARTRGQVGLLVKCPESRTAPSRMPGLMDNPVPRAQIHGQVCVNNAIIKKSQMEHKQKQFNHQTHINGPLPAGAKWLCDLFSGRTPGRHACSVCVHACVCMPPVGFIDIDAGESTSSMIARAPESRHGGKTCFKRLRGKI